MQTISLVLLKKVVVCLHMSGVSVRQFLRWHQQCSFSRAFNPFVFVIVFLRWNVSEVLSWPTVGKSARDQLVGGAHNAPSVHIISDSRPRKRRYSSSHGATR